MRYVVSFGDSDIDGLLLFTAYDIKDAYRFIRENTNLDMSTVSVPISFTGNVDELYKMLSLKRRENKKIIRAAHDCRHYWATSAIKGGTDIKSLQDAGGWSSPAMPLRYAESNKVANQGVKLE